MGYYSSVQYSLIVRFIQILLYSHFLVKKQNGHQAHRVEEAALFHTVPFTSLLPASFCTESGSTKRPSALEVLHRHGPCFSKKTKAKPLSEILAHDQSRVDAIQARLNPTPNPNSNRPKDSKTPIKDRFKDTKVNLPAQPGRSFSTGNYVVTIRLGTPEKALSLTFDTGSDLTWTQCQPCARSCYNQQDPIFDPSASSSYSNISCTSTECSHVGPATGIKPGCSASTCLYGVQYGDRSYSVGFFCKDKLTITPDDVFPDFLFGCGQKNQGLFGYTAGILGLGRDPLSAVSQTASKYENYFSYCLPSISSLTGHLAFGKNSNHVNNVKFTPFAGSQGKPYYFVNIVSVYVGGTQVAIDESVFQAAGSIIDSGTVITRLPPAAYGPMSTAFRQLMTSYTQTGPYSLLDTCYDFGNSTSITIPKVSFGFGGDVVVELAAPGILVVVGPSKACLAFAGNGRDTDVGIFGNTQQKTLEVVYDVSGGKLGFGDGGCK